MSQSWSSPDPQRLHTDRARAESFGAVAEQYDLARPSYPTALIDDLVADAPSDALDVGCGTGKVARLLAARGLSVVGVELDEHMAGVARRHGLTVEVAPFERWDPKGRRFDLVVSGQAWHWIDPSAGVPKAAGVLRPGGTVALFWNVSRLEGAAQRALDDAYRRCAPQLLRHVRAEERNPRPPYEDDLHAEPSLHRAEHREYRWTHTYTRDEWLGLVATQSDHLLLPDDDRRRLFEALGAAVDSVGGVVSTTYDTHTVIARKRR